MTVLHTACGPQHATNVHRDCPRVFAGWGGEVLRCECGCHAGIAMQVREKSASTWENVASPQGALTPAGSDPSSILETNGG